MFEGFTITLDRTLAPDAVKIEEDDLGPLGASVGEGAWNRLSALPDKAAARQWIDPVYRDSITPEVRARAARKALSMVRNPDKAARLTVRDAAVQRTAAEVATRAEHSRQRKEFSAAVSAAAKSPEDRAAARHARRAMERAGRLEDERPLAFEPSLPPGGASRAIRRKVSHDWRKGRVPVPGGGSMRLNPLNLLDLHGRFAALVLSENDFNFTLELAHELGRHRGLRPLAAKAAERVHKSGGYHADTGDVIDALREVCGDGNGEREAA